MNGLYFVEKYLCEHGMLAVAFFLTDPYFQHLTTASVDGKANYESVMKSLINTEDEVIIQQVSVQCLQCA